MALRLTTRQQSQARRVAHRVFRYRLAREAQLEGYHPLSLEEYRALTPTTAWEEHFSGVITEANRQELDGIFNEAYRALYEKQLFKRYCPQTREEHLEVEAFRQELIALFSQRSSFAS